MNACGKFRELILTNYIDGEMDEKTHDRLEVHLKICPACREFAFEVKKNLVAPFIQAKREPVPVDLWSSIKTRIENESLEESDQLIPSFWERLLNQLFVPRLVPVLATVVLLVLVSSPILQKIQTKQANEADRSEYLVSVLGSAGTPGEMDKEELGTPIERYFL